MKKTLFLLVALFNYSVLAEYRSYFSPEDQLMDAVSKEVAKAKYSIDISIYSFRNEGIKELLLQKATEGVSIRIVINNGRKESVVTFTQEMAQLGADVRYVNKINHHKFLIIDEEVLINSSANLTGTALAQSYDENMVICDDCNIRVAAYQREFNYLHNNAMPVHTKLELPQAHISPSPISDEQVVLFTSDNFIPSVRSGGISFSSNTRSFQGAVDSKLIEAIDSATNSIKIATGHFRSKPLFDAIVDAIERGIQVDIVLDGQEYISYSAQKKENSKVETCMNEYNSVAKCYKSGLHFGRLLAYAGANIRFKYYMLRWYFPMAPQMHHKYMIIDEEKLYSGSYNWSYNAEFKSFENVGIYSDSSLISDYLNNFDYVASYGNGDNGYEEMMARYQNAEASIETVFEPISMTYKQIDALRRLAYTKCNNLYRNSNSARSCSF